jgi:hypothetical protein
MSKRIFCPCGLASVEGTSESLGKMTPTIQCLGCGRAFNMDAMAFEANVPEGYVRPTMEGGTLVEHVAFFVRRRQPGRRGLRATLRGVVACTVCSAHVNTAVSPYRAGGLTITAGRLAAMSERIQHRHWCP